MIPLPSPDQMWNNTLSLCGAEPSMQDGYQLSHSPYNQLAGALRFKRRHHNLEQAGQSSSSLSLFKAGRTGRDLQTYRDMVKSPCLTRGHQGALGAGDWQGSSLSSPVGMLLAERGRGWPPSRSSCCCCGCRPARLPLPGTWGFEAQRHGQEERTCRDLSEQR